MHRCKRHVPDTLQPPELHSDSGEPSRNRTKLNALPFRRSRRWRLTNTSNGDAEQPGSQTSGAAGGRPGSPDGDDRYAKVSVFGVEGKGNKFVYVFDRSSSMEGAPLAAAKRQLLESLESLDSVHQFHIIFFNHRLRMFDVTGGGRRIAFATDRNKKLAANFVGGITADGGTDRFAALKQALAFRPDVIFFLTDADDPMSASEMADLEQVNSRLGDGHLRDRIRPHANRAAEKLSHRASRAKRRAVWLRQYDEAAEGEFADFSGRLGQRPSSRDAGRCPRHPDPGS